MAKELRLPESDFLLYTTPAGDVRVDVLFSDESVWLTQKRMAELFETTPQNITIHLKNLYAEGEISEASTCKEFLQVQKEGPREIERKTLFYKLEAIISVGYRVNSEKAVRFRQWATKTLREFVIKGFVLDDERLKNGVHFGKDYFDDLLERIREIRISERRLYQKIGDIYE
ncbi:MAG: RhuM family protein, partial [Patescibacteria group bacterium]